jgi:integrase
VTPTTSHVAFSPRSGWSSVFLASDPGGVSGLQNVVHRQNLGNFTNHSLCAICTTTLFDAGIPEAIIQKRTGHRSLKALRTYERVTPAQEQVVAGVLGPVVPVQQ